MRKTHPHLHFASALLGIAALTLAASPLRADDSAEIKQLRAQIKALEQRLDQIEQKEAQQAQAAAAAPAAPVQAQQAQIGAATTTQPDPSAPKIKIDDTGFTFASADQANFIKLHGLVQLDSRWFLDNDGISNNDGFLIRRARLIFEGGFNKIYSFLLVPEFGGGGSGTSNAPVIYDANLGLALSPALKFTAGKFKSPIGQEMLQNDAVLLFTERSIANNLVPFRDVGLMASGDLFGGTLSYNLALLNGGADATYTSNVALDNNKDAVARLIAKPFRNDKDSPLHGLGFGIAGSHGSHNQSSGLTTGYKSDGQQTFFTYNSSVVPYGDSWRVAPQANYYECPISLLTEYTKSAVNVLSGKTQSELQNHAWQVAAGWVLTGENAAYEGVKPNSPFSPGHGTWGAWELAARVGELKIDPKAFSVFANPAASASSVDAWGIGLNWYLSKTVRVILDYFQNDFGHPVAVATFTNPVIAQEEKAIVTRFQVGF